MRCMTEYVDSSYYHGTQDLCDIAAECGVEASDSTVYHAFAREGYHYHIPYTSPFISEEQQRTRYEWCWQLYGVTTKVWM